VGAPRAHAGPWDPLGRPGARHGPDPLHPPHGAARAGHRGRLRAGAAGGRGLTGPALAILPVMVVGEVEQVCRSHRSSSELGPAGGQEAKTVVTHPLPPQTQ
jgi:hypothetical protein